MLRAAIFAVFSALLSAAIAPAQPRPNVVFIMADDLGHGHLGCYGQTIIQTPNIDRLAREGLRFTQAYAGCTVCAPSRSVLMTGLHTGHTPVRANSGGVSLRDEDVTVAEVLKKAGYATGCFGKWGLGEHGTAGVPWKQGFDEFFGYLHQVHAHSHYPPYLWHNDKRYPLPQNGGHPRDLTGDRRGQHSHDEITAKALHFIRRNKDRPFFCYIPYTIPHVEILAPEESVKPYRGRFEETPYVDKNKHYADQPTPRAVYAGMVAHMDKSVGQILGLLEELKIDDNTIVFFTSDNGAQSGAGTDPEFFNGNGGLRGYKGSFYEGGIRTPLLVRWPRVIKQPRVVHQVTYFADVLPTLAELAGAAVPSNLDGISLVPTLDPSRGQPQPQHAYLYWELTAGKGRTQAARMGDWKAVRPKPGADLELYDLRFDPTEAKNVAAAHPEIVVRMELILKDARVDPPPQIEPVKPEGRLFR